MKKRLLALSLAALMLLVAAPASANEAAPSGVDLLDSGQNGFNHTDNLTVGEAIVLSTLVGSMVAKSIVANAEVPETVPVTPLVSSTNVKPSEAPAGEKRNAAPSSEPDVLPLNADNTATPIIVLGSDDEIIDIYIKRDKADGEIRVYNSSGQIVGIYIADSTDHIILVGVFGTVNVMAQGITVNAASSVTGGATNPTTIAVLNIFGSETTVNIGNGATVDRAVIDADSTRITGSGTVTEASYMGGEGNSIDTTGTQVNEIGDSGAVNATGDSDTGDGEEVVTTKSTITPATGEAVFDLYKPANLEFTVSFGSKAKSITGISCADDELDEDADYLLSGTRLVLREDYLLTLEDDPKPSFIVKFDSGETITILVTVVDTTPETAPSTPSAPIVVEDDDPPSLADSGKVNGITAKAVEPPSKTKPGSAATVEFELDGTAAKSGLYTVELLNGGDDDDIDAEPVSVYLSKGSSPDSSTRSLSFSVPEDGVPDALKLKLTCEEAALTLDLEELYFDATVGDPPPAAIKVITENMPENTPIEVIVNGEPLTTISSDAITTADGETVVFVPYDESWGDSDSGSVTAFGVTRSFEIRVEQPELPLEPIEFSKSDKITITPHENLAVGKTVNDYESTVVANLPDGLTVTDVQMSGYKTGSDKWAAGDIPSATIVFTAEPGYTFDDTPPVISAFYSKGATVRAPVFVTDEDGTRLEVKVSFPALSA